MNFDFLHPREKVAEILQRIYTFGMTTTSGGNVSMRDEEGNIWITPSSVDKGSITSADIVFVKKDGTVKGLHKPSSELPFHLAIYKERPDIKAVVHAHPPILVAFSIIKKIPNTKIIPQAYHLCGKVGYAPYQLPGSEALGLSIAAEFAKGANSVIMENHGTVVGGQSLQRAFARFETLEFCAKMEAQAHAIGRVNSLSEEQIKSYHFKDERAFPTFQPPPPNEAELIVRAKLIKIIQRAYAQKLIISTFGTFSARLGEDAFIITPTARDRYYMRREDLVLIKDGQREAGKDPSRSTLVHRQIYQDHPEVNCIIFAQSPNATAYAVAGKPIDTRTIPESYILLRELPLFPFGDQYNLGDKLSKAISKETPIILIENDSILVTGDSIITTFDRLEVAEFSATSLTQAQLMGTLKPIGNIEIDELKEKFRL
jgi:L-fuculose-phosphate aldolase